MDIFFPPDIHMGGSPLVYKFFTVFSVFEYCLKEIGYARSSRWDDVIPDWDRFVEDIEQSFSWQGDPKLEDAVRYLFDNLPRRQVYRNGHLEWRESRRLPEMGDVEWLLRLVKTVRNNLFHGGKRPFDPDRDARLLQSSIQILLAWAKIHPNVYRVVMLSYQATI